ncbi:hypothetical protein ACSBR1_014788 [Camellia fascicularis]
MDNKSSIAKRWRVLRGYIIHNKEMAQATYDTFISSNESKYAGSSQYVKEDLFAMVGLEQGNPFKQHVTKYLYSTSSTKVPGPLISKTLEE